MVTMKHIFREVNGAVDFLPKYARDNLMLFDDAVYFDQPFGD